MPDNQSTELSATAQAALATAFTVTVDPGGQIFSTITDALNSITDNSQEKEYLLYVGPGTYNEQVTMKPYVSIQGADQSATFIIQPTQPNAFSGGTVNAASNCKLSSVTVASYGDAEATYGAAISCKGVSDFECDYSTLISDDQNLPGVNLCTLNLSLNALDPPSQVVLSDCTITANAQSNESGAIAVGVAENTSTAQLLQCKVVATGETQSFGVVTARGGSVTLNFCYIQGTNFALDDTDNYSPIIANNCQIQGPVSNGVTINNNPPPQEVGMRDE